MSGDTPYAFLYGNTAQTVFGTLVGATGFPTYSSFTFTNALVSKHVLTFGASNISGIFLPVDGVYEATYNVNGVEGDTGATLGPVVALLLTDKDGVNQIIGGSVDANVVLPPVPGSSVIDIIGNAIFKAKKGDQLQLVNSTIIADGTIVLNAKTNTVSLDVPNNIELSVTLVKKD
jgi:hypothetical protein